MFSSKKTAFGLVGIAATGLLALGATTPAFAAGMGDGSSSTSTDSHNSSSTDTRATSLGGLRYNSATDALRNLGFENSTMLGDLLSPKSSTPISVAPQIGLGDVSAPIASGNSLPVASGNTTDVANGSGNGNSVASPSGNTVGNVSGNSVANGTTAANGASVGNGTAVGDLVNSSASDLGASVSDLGGIGASVDQTVAQSLAGLNGR